MVDINEKKQKILSFLQNNGPTLPVRIAKIIEMEPVFASAILSELYSDRKVKMSNMKVGASSLFYLEGQEEKLQDFVDNMKSIEKEVFARIKSRKVLVDDDEEPAMRVAIRSMKDFAIPVERDGKLYWKFAFFSDEEFENYFKPKEEKKQEKEEKNNSKKEEKMEEEKIEEEKKTIEEKKEERIEEKEEKKIDNEMRKKEENEEKKKIWKSNRLEGKSASKEEKNDLKMVEIFDEGNSDFFDEVKDFLEKNDIKILEEIQVDKKEIVAKIRLKTKISDLKYLLIAKNKKSISKDEVNVILQRSNYHKMPCLVILRKEPSKNIINVLNETSFIILGILD